MCSCTQKAGITNGKKSKFHKENIDDEIKRRIQLVFEEL